MEKQGLLCLNDKCLMYDTLRKSYVSDNGMSLYYEKNIKDASIFTIEYGKMFKNNVGNNRIKLISIFADVRTKLD